MSALDKIATKKAKIEFIRSQLEKDDRWMLRGLVAIYAKQTSEEQVAMQTKEHNGVGFTGVDGEILTSFAQQVIRRDVAKKLTTAQPVAATEFLSPKQVIILRKKMPKYASQLLAIASH